MNWSPIAAATSVPLILEKLKNRFPFVEKPDKYPPYSILNERYNKWYIFFSLLVFPSMIIGGYIVLMLLQKIASWWVPDFSNAIFELNTDPLSFLLPAIFLGILTGAATMFAITKIFLGKRNEEYYYYSNWRNKSDGVKIIKLFAKIITPPAILLAVLMIDYYSVIYKDNITINDFTSFTTEKEYTYSDISRIEHSTWEDDNANTNHRYTIIFKDDYDWDFSTGFFSLSDKKRDAILNHLINETGTMIIEKTD